MKPLTQNLMGPEEVSSSESEIELFSNWFKKNIRFKFKIKKYFNLTLFVFEFFDSNFISKLFKTNILTK